MQKTFLYHNTLISYTIEGTGKRVVLLHGFGEDSSVWKYQVDFLKEHCMVIVPDLPGSGRSALLSLETGIRSQKSGVRGLELEENINTKTPVSRLQSPGFISIDDYADCIYALLQNEHISSCIMLGHSMGGYVVLAFAEKYGSVLSAFGLIHSTAFADAEEKKKSREKGMETIEKYGPYPFLKNTTPNLFSARFKQQRPEKVEELIEQGKQFTTEALVQYYRAMMMRPDRTAVLSSNRLPVLFVIGTEDVAAPLADMIKQASMAHISYIYVLQQTGHMGMWEEPGKLNGQVLTFINH